MIWKNKTLQILHRRAHNGPVQVLARLGQHPSLSFASSGSDGRLLIWSVDGTQIANIVLGLPSPLNASVPASGAGDAAGNRPADEQGDVI